MNDRMLNRARAVIVSTGLVLTAGMVPRVARADDASLFAHKWAGMVTQSDSVQSEPLEIELEMLNNSTLHGVVTYPAQGCKGELIQESFDDGAQEVQMKEHITVNAWDGVLGHRGCLEYADVKLTAVGGGSAFNLDFVETTPVNPITVEGTLTNADSIR